MSGHQTPTHPQGDNMTMQMPKTIPITIMDLAKGKSQEIQPQEGVSADINPPVLEISQLEQALHGPEQSQCQKTCFSKEKTGQFPPHLHPPPTINVKAQPHETLIPFSLLHQSRQKKNVDLGPNCPICIKV